ncbi:ferredoxin [Mycobacterium sp. SMC-2]|uniref:ferredoxin n=1 Tax=Mycobacterium sp. SMC-2 TaxID=2857058 RepID=UPI0021B1F1A2|nr:ferredoxin [Mycobacterium sp. SMC-2]UXA06121.1 ferredoxin [Mycobacterium sp. SMC-2]
MKVHIDLTKCSGMGLCELAAPSIFEVGEDGQTHLIAEPVSDDDAAAVDEAVRNCPTMALSFQR